MGSRCAIAISETMADALFPLPVRRDIERLAAEEPGLSISAITARLNGGASRSAVARVVREVRAAPPSEAEAGRVTY